MRKFTLRVVKYPVINLATGEEVPEREDEFNYKKHLNIMLRQPANPQSGMTFKDMITAFEIIDRMRSVKGDTGTILLTEAQWQYLKDRIENGRYSIAHEAIRQLMNDLMEAPTVENEHGTE